jgi:hypothetical protein
MLRRKRNVDMTADVVGFFMDGIFATAATLLSGVLIVAANVG